MSATSQCILQQNKGAVLLGETVLRNSLGIKAHGTAVDVLVPLPTYIRSSSNTLLHSTAHIPLTSIKKRAPL